jgi:hypothetical protein
MPLILRLHYVAGAGPMRWRTAFSPKSRAARPGFLLAFDRQSILSERFGGFVEVKTQFNGKKSCNHASRPTGRPNLILPLQLSRDRQVPRQSQPLILYP